MKKIYTEIASLILVAAASASMANAQTIDDALTFANRDYYGTARTIGMGNAVTATGGDLGTIDFNPAGAAVASYSQISLTPGLSVSMTSGQFAPSATKLAGGTGSNTQTRFIVPNVGLTFQIDTHRDRGVKRVTFGYVMNASNFYNDAFSARREGFGSFAGRLASSATGISPLDLYNNNADAVTCLAYNTGAINADSALPANEYLGINENYKSATNTYLAPRIGQEYSRSTYGNKLDHLLNISLNISDVLYLGANLGLVSTSYTMKENIVETDIKAVTYDYNFSSFSYRYNYSQRSTGVFGKFGFLLTPFDGLRIGGAIQTPTSYNVSERFGHAMDVRWYKDDIAAAAQNKNATVGNSSDTGTTTWDYSIITPFRFNVGVAYNIGGRILVSGDYEMVNYGQTRFRARSYSDELYFENVNKMIRGNGDGTQCLTTQHIARAGVEIKMTNKFRIRGGYNFQTSGLGTSTSGGVTAISDKTANLHSACAGLGYYSNGSFFCDLACRYTWRPQRSTQIYGDYDFNYEDPTSGTIINATEAPVVIAKRKLLTIALTLGWRF